MNLINTALPKPVRAQLFWVEWVALLVGVGLLTLIHRYGPVGAVGAALVVASFFMRWLRTGHIVPRTSLEIPWLLFIVSGSIATWAVYDRSLALLQIVRILSACVLFYALVESSQATGKWVAFGFVLVAAELSVYWMASNGNNHQISSFGSQPGQGGWTQAFFPQVTNSGFQTKTVASALSLAIPFGITLAWNAWRDGRHWLALLAGVSSVFIAMGIITTGNRWAWIGLSVTGVIAYLIWVWRCWPNKRTRNFAIWSGIIVAFGLLMVAVGLLGIFPDYTYKLIANSLSQMQSKLFLWRRGLYLIREYAFTGVGLMNYPLPAAVYGLLIHVPYYINLDNTFLEVWAEQGILGAFGIIWCAAVLLYWVWQALVSENVPALAWAGLAACLVVAVHGLFDVVFYTARTAPLIGLALGYASWVKRSSQKLNAYGSIPKSIPYLKEGLMAFLIFGTLLFNRQLATIWLANLGALSQSRIELARYDPDNFDNPTMDAIRRQNDLGQAEEYFMAALRLDGNNMTALQRLSSIALSQGKYERALTWMQSAWEAGYRDETTRLLYGDTLVAVGDIQTATEVLRGISWAEGRLLFQAWYRYWNHGDEQRAADAWRTVLLLNPDNSIALYWNGVVEDRLNQP